MALPTSETLLLLTMGSRGSVLICACATALCYTAVVLTPNNLCKNSLLNQKCFQFSLMKEDFEHSDPFPRVLGPAGLQTGILCFYLRARGMLMTHTVCLILPVVGSLKSWVIVTRMTLFCSFESLPLRRLVLRIYGQSP